MRSTSIVWAFLLAVTLAVVSATRGARARVAAEIQYSKAQTYSGALRYLRVDLGYEVVEKDPDAAYLMFRYQPSGNGKLQTHGSIEIIESETKTQLFVQLPKMPEYHERMLTDGLLKKLRTEYGAPNRNKGAKKPEPPSDAGTKR
jgi:hypothetical protein